LARSLSPIPATTIRHEDIVGAGQATDADRHKHHVVYTVIAVLLAYLKNVTTRPGFARLPRFRQVSDDDTSDTYGVYHIDDWLRLIVLGLMPMVEQQGAVTKDNRRAIQRYMISTNIGETTLIIPGIWYIIDSGLSKASYHNPRQGSKMCIWRQRSPNFPLQSSDSYSSLACPAFRVSHSWTSRPRSLRLRSFRKAPSYLESDYPQGTLNTPPPHQLSLCHETLPNPSSTHHSSL
jgi:hypothetical protein